MFEKLPHTTSRLEARDANGRISYGTGFYFDFRIDERRHITMVMTNKHVVEGAVELRMYVTRRTRDMKPFFGQFNAWTIENIADIIIDHPDPGVDLAAFPVGEVLMAMDDQGIPAYTPYFSKVNLPREEDIQHLFPVEDVYMIGYPSGIWDEANNLPIIRRGITATPYAIDYELRSEFFIDAACFPGSSGSPVVMVNRGRSERPTGVAFTDGVILLGLLWGGPQIDMEGQIVARPVPTSQVSIVSKIPINLGYCIKSRAILELEPLILARVI